MPYLSDAPRDLLHDARGPVLAYLGGDRYGRPLADVAEVVAGRRVDEAVVAALAAWPGWVVATEDEPLATALLDAGAQPRRHAFVMSAPLPQPGAAVTLATVPRDAVPVTDLLPGWRAAYPPGHPDHEPGTDEEVIASDWAHYDTAEWRAVEHRSTGLLVRDGHVAAGVIVSLRPEPAPLGGPWVNDVWVDPRDAGRGLGAALLRQAQALLAEDGHATLGLAVSAGNPARAVYERCGFGLVLESWSVVLPGAPATD